MELQIVVAGANDFRLLADMRADMATEMGHPWHEEEFPSWRERYADYFFKKQLEEESQTFVASVNGSIIGMSSVSLVDDYHRHTRGQTSGRINCVYVTPEYRRKGVATALVNACLDWLRAKGCAAARLNSSEQAQTLYESLGFRPRRELELRW